MHDRTVIIGVLASSLLLSACTSTGGESARKLDDATWELKSYLDGASMKPVPDGVYVDAVFTSGKVSGSAGCNRYSGSFSTSDNKLTLGMVASTKMACRPPVSDVETAYLTRLSESAAYTTTQDSLTILDGHGATVLTFGRSKAALSGVTWHLIAYSNGKTAVVSTVAGSDPTITFETNGQLGGMGTCNTYGAPYSVDGRNLKIGPIAATMMACANQDLSDQESLYLAALQTSATYAITGKHLSLRTASGAIAAEFEQR